jgi:hypothetical protein
MEEPEGGAQAGDCAAAAASRTATAAPLALPVALALPVLLALSYHASAVRGCNVTELTCSSEPEELRLASRDLARQADQYGLSVALRLLHQGARLLRPSLPVATFPARRLKFRVGHGPFRGSSY